jgi:cell division cycle protein 20 (cofactor of APC complex)
MTKLRDLDGHSARVSCLSWNGQNVISSGGRDSSILNRDLREPPSSTSFGTFNCHIHEVCGLAWSPDGKTLASGGNDNMLCLWDAAISNSNVGRVSLGGRSSIGSIGSSFNDLNPRRSYLVGSHSPRNIIRDHTAAVKALAWCPFQRNVLASGGGTADRCIRIRNTDTNSVLHCVNTGSQVCALQWSDEYRELVSSHGFSDNQLILWKYPSMTKVIYIYVYLSIHHFDALPAS